MSNLDIECGLSAAQPKCAYGETLDGVDGVWQKGVHPNLPGTADFYYADYASKPMWNIFCTECFADVTAGYGLLFAGTTQIQTFTWSGTISPNGNSTTSVGVGGSGTGGLRHAVFDIEVDGTGTTGFYWNASNTNDIVIRPRAFTNNNYGATTGVDIDIESGSDWTISGGVLDGYNIGTSNPQSTAGIRIGASVSDVSVTGVRIKGHTTNPATVASGATNISFTGGDYTGNTSNAIVNNAALNTVFASGVIGVPYFAYTPVWACGSGSGTWGSVSGRYMLSGKHVDVWATGQLTAVGTCATTIYFTMPATPNEATVLGAVENNATGIALKAVTSSGVNSTTVMSQANAFYAGANYTYLVSGSYESQ